MICSKCKQDLDIKEFSFKNKSKNTYSKYCKICQRNYAKQHYAQHKDQYITRAKSNNKKQKQQIRLYIQQYKQNIGCKICNESDPCCLDFHHLDPTVKDFNIGQMASRYLSIEQFETEIKKCVVVCSNCHRKIHSGHLSL